MERDTQFYIDKGYIDLSNNVTFKRTYEACNCFGHSYEGYQRGGASHAVDSNMLLWFPKFYENDTDWENEISADGETITERNKKHVILQEDKDWLSKKIIVFAHEPDQDGELLYRFKGVFQYDKDQSINNSVNTYKRIDTRVRTYSSIK